MWKQLPQLCGYWYETNNNLKKMTAVYYTGKKKSEDTGRDYSYGVAFK